MEARVIDESLSTPQLHGKYRRLMHKLYKIAYSESETTPRRMVAFAMRDALLTRFPVAGEDPTNEVRIAMLREYIDKYNSELANDHD